MTARAALVAALVAVLLGAACSEGGDAGNAGGPRPFGSFGQIGFRVERDGRPGPARCALLADNDFERGRGLMERTDLAGHDGMIFRFQEDTTVAFYMRNTPMPLSIAWFDGDGGFVSSADMTPCPNREGCPLYPPAGPFRYALEVRRGGLAGLGVGPGSRLVLGPSPCPR
jgi:uncharacterized protein